MKNFINILGLSGLFLMGTVGLAVTVGGNEPPAKYMENLVNCTPSTAKSSMNSYIQEYKINGETSDGRCKVTITGYYDFSDPQTYKDYIFVMKGFAGAIAGQEIPDSKIPTQAQLIEEMKNKKEITVCKFIPAQVRQLYLAYQKHDGKNSQGTIKRDKDGNLESFSGSFSTSDMSSYDKLMMNYSMGTCTSNN